MNILVTGANGQLGREMRIVAANSGDNYIFSDVSRPEGLPTLDLDITDPQAVRTIVEERSIGAVINCAAYTAVDAAQENYDRAELLNAGAVRNLAVAMKEADGVLVHVSTDYVFGGEPCNTPYREEQKGSPTGVYGVTKLLGEKYIRQVGCRHIILRTAWLYSEFGRNFVKTMLELTASKPQLKVVFDQVGTPTYAYDLAQVICSIVSSRKFEGNTGVYHYSNEGVCSWFDFAKMIAQYAGHRDCDIQPCRSDEFPAKVTRPAYSVLDKALIKQTFGVRIPYWTDSLKVCIKNLKNV